MREHQWDQRNTSREGSHQQGQKALIEVGLNSESLRCVDELLGSVVDFSFGDEVVLLGNVLFVLEALGDRKTLGVADTEAAIPVRDALSESGGECWVGAFACLLDFALGFSEGETGGVKLCVVFPNAASKVGEIELWAEVCE